MAKEQRFRKSSSVGVGRDGVFMEDSCCHPVFTVLEYRKGRVLLSGARRRTDFSLLCSPLIQSGKHFLFVLLLVLIKFKRDLKLFFHPASLICFMCLQSCVTDFPFLLVNYFDSYCDKKSYRISKAPFYIFCRGKTAHHLSKILLCGTAASFMDGSGFGLDHASGEQSASFRRADISPHLKVPLTGG